MRNLKEQTETIQLSLYCNIICIILKNHKQLSVCKLLVFSYVIKKSPFLGGTIYNANNTQDVVYKGLSLLSGDFDEFCNNISYIIKAFHILINNNIVSLENNIATLTDSKMPLDEIYKESNFLKKVIDESKTMTDRQFIKEVTYNV